MSSFGFTEMPVMVGFMLFNELALTAVSPLLTFIASAISRRFEFQADDFACTLGYRDELQTGLVKVRAMLCGSCARVSCTPASKLNQFVTVYLI